MLTNSSFCVQFEDVFCRVYIDIVLVSSSIPCRLKQQISFGSLG